MLWVVAIYSAFILQNKTKMKYPHPKMGKLVNALTSWCQSPLPISLWVLVVFFCFCPLLQWTNLPQKWKLQFLTLIPLQSTDLHNYPWKKLDNSWVSEVRRPLTTVPISNISLLLPTAQPALAAPISHWHLQAFTGSGCLQVLQHLAWQHTWPISRCWSTANTFQAHHQQKQLKRSWNL